MLLNHCSHPQGLQNLHPAVEGYSALLDYLGGAYRGINYQVVIFRTRMVSKLISGDCHLQMLL